jgi:histidinol-phosphate aminotransferase
MAGDRAHLRTLLEAVTGVEVVSEASASFLLVRIRDGLAVRAALRERGFTVRRGDTFPGLGPDWLRIAVRDQATASLFAKALREVLSEPSRRTP